MASDSYYAEFEIETDDNTYLCMVDIDYEYDEGTWYDSDGGGVAPSSDVDWRIVRFVDEDGKESREFPKGISEGDIEDLVMRWLEENV
jgi:hypothetical protein